MKGDGGGGSGTVPRGPAEPREATSGRGDWVDNASQDVRGAGERPG